MTLTKSIYIIKNDINDKLYVGQAADVHSRWLHHKHDANYESRTNAPNMSPLHRDMVKYGYEHFQCEVIESDATDYDAREMYWIKQLNTLAPNGYNVSPGNGQQSIYAPNAIFKSHEELMHCISQISSTKKSFDNIAKEYGCTNSVISTINTGDAYRQDDLVYPLREKRYSDEKIKQIRYSLKYEPELTFCDISRKYHVDMSQLSLINQGRIYYVDSEVYPLRTKRFRDLSQERVRAIIDDMQNSSLCFSDIAKKHHVGAHTISQINVGSFYHQDDVDYPIRDQKDWRSHSSKKFLEPEDIQGIISLLRTDMSINEIAEKYNLSDTMIRNINNGKIKKYHDDQQQYPIRNFRRKAS